jgi:hypothetical protein
MEYMINENRCLGNSLLKLFSVPGEDMLGILRGSMLSRSNQLSHRSLAVVSEGLCGRALAGQVAGAAKTLTGNGSNPVRKRIESLLETTRIQ